MRTNRGSITQTGTESVSSELEAACKVATDMHNNIEVVTMAERGVCPIIPSQKVTRDGESFYTWQQCSKTDGNQGPTIMRTLLTTTSTFTFFDCGLYISPSFSFTASTSIYCNKGSNFSLKSLRSVDKYNLLDLHSILRSLLPKCISIYVTS